MRLTTRDFEVLETHRDQVTLTHGLRIAADKFERDAALGRETAAVLRAGEKIPMFAEGEAGARAAEALAEQFERQVRETRSLADRIDEAVAVVLSRDEDMEWTS